MSDVTKMWVHCNEYVPVAPRGQEFATLQPCPAGHGPDIKPLDLYELCVSCPRRGGVKRRPPMAKPQQPKRSPPRRRP